MFYTFEQNNSGGTFVFDKRCGLTHYVIIEADNISDACDRAERIGIYFNGVEDGTDCPCCGDRWSYSWGEKGNEVPTLYGEPVETATIIFCWIPGEEVFIHYKDGTIKGYTPPSTY